MKKHRESTLWVALAMVAMFVCVISPPVDAGAYPDDTGDLQLEEEQSWAYGHDRDDDDDDDDDDRDDDGDDHCILVCHKPGTPAEKTKCLSKPAVRGHLRHGDYIGACDRWQGGETILDVLVRTDGVQALVAAVLVVDESLDMNIAGILDDPRANLVLFAPGNRAFEDVLKLEEGDLDGLSIEAIAGALPSILAKLLLSPEAVRDILLKHLAFNPGPPDVGSEDGLLKLRKITVADESVFPISIGSKDVLINYESHFTKSDVRTVNGFIHYLDTVIVDAAEEAGVVQVFVTSQGFDGDFGDQAGGDAECTAAAAAATLDGNWTAWLGKGSCEACDDPRDRIIDAEYQLLDGTVVANDLADLTDGTLDHPINMDENRIGQVVANVWTGADADGTGGSSPGTCSDWTANDAETRAQIGDSSAVDESWTDVGGGNTCDRSNRIYCFSDSVFTPDPPDETEICSRELCSRDQDLAQRCEDFLVLCLPNEPTEDCIATAALICREEI